MCICSLNNIEAVQYSHPTYLAHEPPALGSSASCFYNIRRSTVSEWLVRRRVRGTYMVNS